MRIKNKLTCTRCGYFDYEYDGSGNTVSDRRSCRWVPVCWECAPCEEEMYDDDYGYDEWD